ncbi:hypothetical protein [Longispora albida]|uniref:hypothetical protein n=1 Tax=Longispora albida TaxID=203523 RepID=UPI0012FBBBF2|nr:hypothetical protein [Longispora albida]
MASREHGPGGPPGQPALVRPEQVRAHVPDLPGWPQSASALLGWLRERITQEQLLAIAGMDPFGAPGHLRILTAIWKSGRVPRMLEFEPGEALRLYQWPPRANADPLALAFCCTLLCISPSVYDDGDNASYAAPLAASCLALGGEAPVLAEQLMAWRGPDPVALLALAVLRTATDPGDPRLPSLLRTLAGAAAEPETLPWQLRTRLAAAMTGGHRRDWRDLVTAYLEPRRAASPDIDRLLTGLRAQSRQKRGQ